MLRLLIYVLIVISFLDMFVQLPIMSPFAQDLGSSALMIGLIVGLYSFTNMFGNIAAGRWVDRLGAKKIFIIGLLSTAIILFLYVFVQVPWQLALVRFLHGFVSGLLVPSIFTYVSDRGREGRQGRNMAVSGAAVGIAAVLGPAMGSILKAQLGINSVFISVAVLMLIAGIVSFLVLPVGEQKRTAESRKDQSKTRNSVAIVSSTHIAPESKANFYKNPYVIQSYIGAFALMFNMGILTYMLPLKVRLLEMNEQSSGMLMSVFGLVAILFFVLPTNRMFDAISSRVILILGIGVVALSMFSLSIFNDAMLYVMMGVYGVGYALMFPSMNKMIVDHVPKTDRGKAFGLFYAFYSLGVVAGSFVIGVVTDSPNTGFTFSAVFLVLMGALIYGWGIVTKKKSLMGNGA